MKISFLANELGRSIYFISGVQICGIVKNPLRNVRFAIKMGIKIYQRKETVNIYGLKPWMM
jgi:hypothetical protein